MCNTGLGESAAKLQMNQLTLRNNRLKFKTSRKLPIILEEYMEYTSHKYRKTERSQHGDRLDLET